VARGLAWPLKQVIRLLSRGIRSKARQQGMTYTFLFMRANGRQLSEITSLVESGAIRPVIDRVVGNEHADTRQHGAFRHLFALQS